MGAIEAALTPTGADRETPGGWAIVVSYACVVACTQMLWLTFAPIDTNAARDFGVSASAVGWLAQVFPLLYVVLALPAGIALDRRFRFSLLAGAGLTAVGGLVRLIDQSYLWALLGQLVIATAQPLVLGALTKTATGYLSPSQRPTGIAIGSAGQFIGAIAALVMGPLLIGRHSLGSLLPAQACIACAAFLLLLVAMLRRAPLGGGPPAAIGRRELREVWAVPLMRTLSVLAFLGIGVFVALSTWLQPILHVDGISATAAGAMLAGMLLAGTIGCGIVPALVARRGAERSYLLLVVVWVAGCCGLLAAVHPVLAADAVLIAALGFVLLASLPVILELTERRMGALGGVATGFLLLAGNAGGLIVAVLVDLVVGVPVAAFLLLAIVALCGLPAARRVSSARLREG
jgi:predicted MFS family arabinose efflux permease